MNRAEAPIGISKDMEMDLKEYMHEPDEGMFEKIEHRLKVRRAARIGGVAGVLVVAGIVAATILWPSSNPMAEGTEVREATETAVARVEMEPAVAAPLADEQPQRAEMRETHAAEMPEPVAPVPAAEEEEELTAEMLPESHFEPARVVEPVETKHPEGVTAMPETRSRAKQVADKAERQTAKSPTKPESVVWAPNIILPAGEDDENRYFRVKSPSQLNDFKIYIYNRGGRKVYSSSSQDFVWDATVNGVQVPQGAYVWVITYRDENGTRQQERGTVTVVR